MAREAAKADSDVDLFVVGDLGLERMVELLAGVEDILLREVNPHVMSEAEFARRVRDGEHFVSSVLAAPKLMVIGDEEQVAAMG